MTRQPAARICSSALRRVLGLAAACLALFPLTADAQLTSSMVLGVATFQDSIGAAPVISTSATQVPPEAGPYVVTLEVALQPLFAILLHQDAREGTSAAFQLPRLLPQRTRIHIRVQARDRFGVIRATNEASFVTRSYLRIVGPDGPRDVAQDSARPRFTWTPSPVTAPPGPWRFDVDVINTATGLVEIRARDLADTTWVPPDSTPLQANTSYRWMVSGRIAGGPIIAADTSSSTFVVNSGARVTLFYNNFPNPFPAATSTVTCFWFDLATPAEVQLVVRDLRGRTVRTILDARVSMPRGEYGRRDGTAPPGDCDSPYRWDGSDERGRTVPPGVYYAHFRAGTVRRIVPVVFRGR